MVFATPPKPGPKTLSLVGVIDLRGCPMIYLDPRLLREETPVQYGQSDRGWGKEDFGGNYAYVYMATVLRIG